MSNSIVSRLRLFRYVGHTFLLVLAAIAALFVCVHVQEYIFRNRVERLAADVRALRVRKSTFPKATEVFSRWGGSGDYSVPCSGQYCDFSIRLNELGGVPGRSEGWFRWAETIHRLAGGRISLARAWISVREGIVWRTEFELLLDVPPFKNSSGEIESYTLEGRVSAIPRLVPYSFRSSQPEFEIHWPHCDSCEPIWVDYTPYARPADLNRIAQLNFDCIVSWRQCRSKADLMPGAMAQRAVEDRLLGNGFQFECGAEAIQTIARDAENAAIVDLEASRPDDEGTLMKVRLLQTLKGSTSWGVGEGLSLGVANGTIPAKYIAGFKTGSRIVILFDRNPHPRGPVPIVAELCGIVPFTEKNLKLVNGGIKQDDVVHLPSNPASEVRPTFETPPKFSDPPGPPR